jgi:hypothetical protein
MNEKTRKCPKEIIEAVTEILYIAILRIRNVGNRDTKFCSKEADHIHNLPHLIKNYKKELLKYYLDIERPSYINHSLAIDIISFEPSWKKLEAILNQPDIK